MKYLVSYSTDLNLFCNNWEAFVVTVEAKNDFQNFSHVRCQEENVLIDANGRVVFRYHADLV